MKSLEELSVLREKLKASQNLRNDTSDDIRVLVGMATCGIAAGATPVLDAFTEEVAKKNLRNVMVTKTGCIGMKMASSTAF